MFRLPFRSEHGLCSALILAAIAAACSPLAAADNDAAYLLKYKFQPGQFWYYEVENTMRIVTQYKGASEDQSNNSQAWKQLRVVAVDEHGQATLEPMIERVIMKAVKAGDRSRKYFLP